MTFFNWWHEGWDPFAEVTRLQNEINQLFDAQRKGPWPFWGRRVLQEFPAVNLYEIADGYELVVELPGVDPKELDLSITATTITLKGERKDSTEMKEKKALRQERNFGHFARAIVLPEEIDSTKVEASYTHGLLKIRLPKREELKPKQIQVKVS